jgi:hypothetical protein
MTRIIQRLLPQSNYTLVSLRPAGEHDIRCENCRKKIKWVAKVKDLHNDYFDIGVDCCERLIQQQWFEDGKGVRSIAYLLKVHRQWAKVFQQVDQWLLRSPDNSYQARFTFNRDKVSQTDLSFILYEATKKKLKVKITFDNELVPELVELMHEHFENSGKLTTHVKKFFKWVE